MARVKHKLPFHLLVLLSSQNCYCCCCCCCLSPSFFIQMKVWCTIVMDFGVLLLLCPRIWNGCLSFWTIVVKDGTVLVCVSSFPTSGWFLSSLCQVLLSLWSNLLPLRVWKFLIPNRLGDLLLACNVFCVCVCVSVISSSFLNLHM
jgi:hypothetical protein